MTLSLSPASRLERSPTCAVPHLPQAGHQDKQEPPCGNTTSEGLSDNWSNNVILLDQTFCLQSFSLFARASVSCIQLYSPRHSEKRRKQWRKGGKPPNSCLKPLFLCSLKINFSQKQTTKKKKPPIPKIQTNHISKAPQPYLNQLAKAALTINGQHRN